MKIKVIETKETILELPNNHYESKDYDEENLSDDEIATEFFRYGKKLAEFTEFEDISWNTKVFNYETDEWEEVADDN